MTGLEREDRAAPPLRVAPVAMTRAHKAFALILVAFLLIFPKGGIKLAGIPITWGYLALGATVLWLPLAVLYGVSVRVRPERLVTLAALLPFQIIIWLSLLVNGADSLGYAISLIVTFFAVPTILVFLLGVQIDRLHLGFLFRLLRIAIPLVAAYGIFLFFFKLQTGTFLEIPYLTVNAGDAGGLEDKYIDRGGVFKLISTYNNGNVYGVSLLILLPLYVWLETSALRVGMVKMSLVLTLSRTVWAGLLLHEVLQRVYVKRVSLRALASMTAAMVLLGVGIWYALGLLDADTAFLFDRRLGGRITQFAVLDHAGLWPARRFEGIAEIVYLSVLDNFGLVGLTCFLVGMCTPLALYFSGALGVSDSLYKRSLVSGVLTYLFVAVSDGAILLIPVMVFYWFVVSLLLSDNPSVAAVRLPLGERAGRSASPVGTSVPVAHGA